MQVGLAEPDSGADAGPSTLRNEDLNERRCSADQWQIVGEGRRRVAQHTVGVGEQNGTGPVKVRGPRGVPGIGGYDLG